MKHLLQLEEFAQFAVALAGLYFFGAHIPWWAWLPVFFAPDLGALGYLINPAVGGMTYNLLHHKAIAIGVTVIGFYMQTDLVLTAGLILYAHSSFDRILGYGLKYPDNFKHTHLGWLGRGERGKPVNQLSS